LGLAATFGEGVMDTFDCCCQNWGSFVFEGTQVNAVAIIVVCNEEVVVAFTGGIGEPASLVGACVCCQGGPWWWPLKGVGIS
jgi:hypothetical protein